MFEQQKQIQQQQQQEYQQYGQQTSAPQFSSPQFQPNPAAWQQHNPLQSASVWASQSQAYNRQYLAASSGIQRVATPQAQRPAATITTPPIPPPESPSGMGISQIIAEAPTPSSDVSLNLDLFDDDTSATEK